MVAFALDAAMTSILVLSTGSPSMFPSPLTIGSPSPQLITMKYAKGDAVNELLRGTIYVVEFSGTECVPCIHCIPHLNQLQKKYADVVFISVYCQPAKAVREFLAGKGKSIAFRVAVDPTGAMRRLWSEPACQDGIPHVFIVGKDGKVAWIGHPADLEEPLTGVVAGTYDAQEFVLRLKVEQGAALRLQRSREREQRGRDEYNRINEMMIAGKLPEALADTEKALAAYRDCPKAAELFRWGRVYLLANLPGKREQAFQLATELAVEAKMSERWLAMLNAARQLLNAAERAGPGTRDKRLVYLALPLLCDPSPSDPDLRGRPEHVLQDYQIATLRSRGWAYHLLGDTPRAAASIRNAIAIIRDQKPPPGANASKFAEDVRGRVQDLQAILREYLQEAAPIPSVAK